MEFRLLQILLTGPSIKTRIRTSLSSNTIATNFEKQIKQRCGLLPLESCYQTNIPCFSKLSRVATQPLEPDRKKKFALESFISCVLMQKYISTLKVLTKIYEFLFYGITFLLMHGSCHFDRSSHDVIGVECRIFGIVIFVNHGQFL